jgi:hypothetical protein
MMQNNCMFILNNRFQLLFWSSMILCTICLYVILVVLVRVGPLKSLHVVDTASRKHTGQRVFRSVCHCLLSGS